MSKNRITEHPILKVPKREKITFKFNGKDLTAKKGDIISSALIANGIKIFGHHPKDGSPQGIFCANGQCSQCMVIVDGKPKKGCMTKLKEGMVIESCEGLPKLPENDIPLTFQKIKEKETEVLIIGGGPAGLSAAQFLGEKRAKIILVDDKDRLGGKLVLQTHKFFGSQEESYAGTRGIEIAKILADEVRKFDNIDIWLNSVALAVFSDQKVGILKDGKYILVKPEKLLVATGAREKNLVFPGNTLPGVYGAGAFQTLVNRDLVRPSKKLFIIGGGNVGLIAGYHALQANIDVIGVVEALPKCGGYKVHKDKLEHSGVPIYTRHTVISANGKDKVESITIAKIDEQFEPIEGSERTFEVDTILIAVGLDSVDEFYHKAKKFNFDVWSAGDAQEIAEASAAMFSGKIQAKAIARSLGLDIEPVPSEWYELLDTLKKSGGKVRNWKLPKNENGVFPIFHCYQEIPCNPCTSVCPINQIRTDDDNILKLPYFKGEKECLGCGRCVAVCPGLAITLIDFRKNPKKPLVTLPFEMNQHIFNKRDIITVVSEDNETLGDFPIKKTRVIKEFPKTQLISVEIPKEYAKKAAGIKIQLKETKKPLFRHKGDTIPDEAIICRCERISAGEIRKWIQKGVTDINQLKAITRAGMGACGAKTCETLIEQLFREEGIPLEKVVKGTKRPLFMEVPLGTFAGIKSQIEDD